MYTGPICVSSVDTPFLLDTKRTCPCFPLPSNVFAPYLSPSKTLSIFPSTPLQNVLLSTPSSSPFRHLRSKLFVLDISTRNDFRVVERPIADDAHGEEVDEEDER